MNLLNLVIKMATLAAVGEQMGSSNFSKQPGPGTERVPGGPLALERPLYPRARGFHSGQAPHVLGCDVGLKCHSPLASPFPSKLKPGEGASA